MTRPIVGFEHLHLHSDKSLLDGFGKAKEYAEKWKNHGKFLSISDHGMLAVVPEQIRACSANGLTPVFSSELYVNPLQIEYNDKKEWEHYLKEQSPENQKFLRKSFHLLAIAYNNIGYKNLVTLTSLAQLKGYYYRPRVNHDQLIKYKEGIVFSSCCYMSEIGQAFDKGGEEKAFAMIEKYMAMFGANFRLEIILLDFEKQKPYDSCIIKANDKYGIPIWITNDCHFCEAGHSKFQRLMLMVQTKWTLKEVEQKLQENGDQDFFFMQDKNLYMKTEEELNEKWEADYSHIIPYEIFEKAKLNTVEMCRMAANVTFDYSMKLPEWKDANERFKDEVLKGFKRKELPLTKEYQSRLKEEFELIFEKNFSSYFLILKATVDEARRYSMEMFGTPNAVGPGRGSDVGSLCCYCLGITTVNPIKHGLLFSRFLSKARKDYPDADIDFIPDVRDYLKDIWAPKFFGADKVCNIGSYNTFGIKSSLIDMARVFDKDRYEILALTKVIGLKDDDGNAITWDSALEMFPDLKKYCEENKEVAEAAKMMVGRTRSMGKHAGGIVISSVPISEFVPLVRGSEGEAVSAWTQGLHDQDLEPVGLIKYDWLIITNLLQINYVCKLVKERCGLSGIWAKKGQEDFSDDAFIEDAKAIAMANEADLRGIFQFDSDGIRRLVRKAGISNFDDLAAITALYRPGPMGEGQHDEFVARKTGVKSYEIHPLLKPILDNTYGIIVYQEQCMRIFNVVGDIPFEHCYNLIKAISKKKKDIFEDYKVQFIENGQKNLNWTLEQVEGLWKQLEGFAGYAFNLSHSVAYTYISFMLLVLKAHYPLEFYTAILHFETEEEKIKEYKLDAERHGIEICPLDLNKSKIKFDISDNKIYFGFSNVKGIGEGVAEKIVKNQPYTNFQDFLEKYGTDESVLKALIGLRLFKDAKPLKLYLYYKFYKDQLKKRADKKKRFNASCKRHLDEAQAFYPDLKEHDEISDLRVHLDTLEEPTKGSLENLIKKHEKCIQTYYGRSATVADKVEGLDKFIVLPDEKHDIDDKLLKLYSSPEQCEIDFYGFLWHHPICNSPDYEGNRTFDVLRNKELKTGRVEVLIKSVAKTISKKNTAYWLMKLEDANGEEVLCQVWEDDWDRFKDELKAGELVKIEVKTPDGGFNRYSLNSPPKWRRAWDVPKTREADFRVFVLRKPPTDDIY